MDYTKVCRLCVNNFEDGKPLYDENGRANVLHEITCKYFHPQIINLNEAAYLCNLCSQCWQKISDFHSFEAAIQLAQLKLLDILVPKLEKGANDGSSPEPMETMAGGGGTVLLSSTIAMSKDNYPNNTELPSAIQIQSDSTVTTLDLLQQSPSGGYDTTTTDLTSPSSRGESPIIIVEIDSESEDPPNPTLHMARKSQGLTRRNYIRCNKTRHDCKLCGLRSLSYEDQLKHYAEKHSLDHPVNVLKTDKGYTMHPCSMCDHRSKFITSYYDHYWIVHKNHPAVYYCDICQRKYAKMRHHCPGPRTTQKTYQCIDCKRSFNDERHIIEHLARQHRKVDLYTCPCCLETFDTVTKIPKHRKQHHPKEDKAEYYQHMDDKFAMLLKKYLEEVRKRAAGE
ncbi:zinc finger protein 184 isoform X2 [Musca domestica]|uniref:Zinc finger protein 184 isoform X2 n=1 Tax=Musca domestica TaxID=7370 RepID=A0ABM3V320_MUSDO|nr:zinc finger protein 184 isoform X2 [Musca domestica]